MKDKLQMLNAETGNLKLIEKISKNKEKSEQFATQSRIYFSQHKHFQTFTIILYLCTAIITENSYEIHFSELILAAKTTLELQMLVYLSVFKENPSD